MSLNSMFGGNSALTLTKDMTVGEVRDGIITGWAHVPATKFGTNDPDFDREGNPKMLLRLDLTTQYQVDAEDTGDRALFVKEFYSGQNIAFGEAIQATGLSADALLVEGTFVQVTYKGKRAVKTKSGNQFEENDYEYELTPATNASPEAQAPPAASKTPDVPAAAAPSNPAEMIAAGWSDAQITAQVPGLTPDVLAWLRSQHTP